MGFNAQEAVRFLYHVTIVTGSHLEAFTRSGGDSLVSVLGVRNECALSTQPYAAMDAYVRKLDVKAHVSCHHIQYMHYGVGLRLKQHIIIGQSIVKAQLKEL